MVDWVTISSLATAGGTLVLAGATFSSVRSANRSARLAEKSLLAANRAARVAEESLLEGMRPLLMPSRPEDAAIRVNFVDNYSVMTPGGGGTAVVIDGAVYLTMSVRNVGSGIAVLHGWRVDLAPAVANAERPPVDDFRRLTRDLYVAPSDVAFWQGAFRDSAEAGVAEVRERIAAGGRIVIDLLYGDHQGGQRAISRFSLLPNEDGEWVATVARHWNVDRPDPR